MEKIKLKKTFKKGRVNPHFKNIKTFLNANQFLL